MFLGTLATAKIKERLTDGASHGAGSRIKAETMPAYAGTIARKQRHSGAVARLLMIPLGAVVAALVFAPMAYMLWPHRGAIAPDAPSLPVTVGGMVFNVPPAADPLQGAAPPGRAAARRPQLRVAVARAARPTGSSRRPTDTPDVNDRLFVTIASDRHHAVADGAAEGDLSALSRRRRRGRGRWAQHRRRSATARPTRART